MNVTSNTIQSPQALLDAFDALADNMEEGLFLGDPPREVSNDKVGSMRVQLTNMKDEIVASNKPGAPKFNPGDALAGLFATRKCAGGKKTCTGAIVKFVTLNKKLVVADETKQNKYVDVQDSKVRQMCPLDAVYTLTNFPHKKHCPRVKHFPLNE